MISDTAQGPGSIRAIIPHPHGGHIVMTGFPGLETSVSGEAFFDPASCEATLKGLEDAGARSLTVLVERDELAPDGFAQLERLAKAQNLALVQEPVPDFSTPSDEMLARWRQGADQRAEVLSAGGALAFSCQYGAGRSGLMASLCLMEAGLSADEAMALVRSHFSDAVESTAQEDWLRAQMQRP